MRSELLKAALEAARIGGDILIQKLSARRQVRLKGFRDIVTDADVASQAAIAAYLGASEQMLMVSGFTDDMPVRGSNRHFADNWELSAQRALTVTRTLIEEGVPSSAIFAAAFGSQQPVAANTDADGRARNRRVEMAPVPKSSAAAREGNG